MKGFLKGGWRGGKMAKKREAEEIQRDSFGPQIGAGSDVRQIGRIPKAKARTKRKTRRY